MSAFNQPPINEKRGDLSEGRPTSPTPAFTHMRLSPSPSPERLQPRVRKAVLTSSHAEQHPEGFAEQGAETDDARHLHTIQIAFDLGDPGTGCHWLGERRHAHMLRPPGPPADPRRPWRTDPISVSIAPWACEDTDAWPHPGLLTQCAGGGMGGGAFLASSW